MINHGLGYILSNNENRQDALQNLSSEFTRDTTFCTLYTSQTWFFPNYDFVILRFWENFYSLVIILCLKHYSYFHFYFLEASYLFKRIKKSKSTWNFIKSFHKTNLPQYFWNARFMIWTVRLGSDRTGVSIDEVHNNTPHIEKL